MTAAAAVVLLSCGLYIIYPVKIKVEEEEEEASIRV
jgi:hypothetical protein